MNKSDYQSFCRSLFDAMQRKSSVVEQQSDYCNWVITFYRFTSKTTTFLATEQETTIKKADHSNKHLSVRQLPLLDRQPLHRINNNITISAIVADADDGWLVGGELEHAEADKKSVDRSGFTLVDVNCFWSRGG